MRPDAINDDSDDLVFLDEGPSQPARATPVWRIMIVDDDADVHTTTTFALANLEMQGRALEFVHAFSAAEAREMLEQETDIAVILLDVVMEQADAGLHLVRHVREKLGRADVRIILRTGQPGYAPEMEAIRGYDINDYRSKSELTRTKLYTAVAAAVRSYQQIRALQANHAGLEHIVRAGADLMALHGMRDFGRGVLTQLASLVGQPADGVLCSRAPGNADALYVMAAAGSCAHLAERVLDGHGDVLVHNAVQRALAERRSIFQPGHLALYFAGKSGREFAACLRVAGSGEMVDPRLLEVFGSVIAVGLDNVELVTHLHKSAFYDQLTGLPNRTRLVELLDATIAGPFRSEAILAVVDIVHFAETNDALGHQFGDALLSAVASRLHGALKGVTVARIAGDVFCVLGNAQAVTPGAISALFAEPFSIEGQDVQVAATLGLVRLGEHEGSGADALKDGDIALKRAKAQHGTNHFWFTRSLGVDIRERVRLMHALRSGFARGELYLAYQPQVDLETGRAFGAEALLRWRTEDGNSVRPDRFIPIAEYSGLIVEIGEWVLREACAELVRLREEGHVDFTMSVNVSQVQFRHPHFLEMLRRALHETGAPPEKLELEITESMAMEEPDALAHMLAQVKRTGVSIAIDDFGTGFSSLSHLQRLQVDRLKIDRSFISEITGSARGSSIAEMVIQLGRNLGLSVIAEGVEDERQAQILGALGCTQAQGFLFARPLTPQELQTWLASPAG
jgi:diguanylate cyclase (GGDEF)-like protein